MELNENASIKFIIIMEIKLIIGIDEFKSDMR